MRELKIRIEPFEVLSVLNYHAVLEPNHHGRAKVTALIDSSHDQSCLAMAKETTWVTVTGEGEKGDRKVLFCGVLSSLSIKKDTDTSVMELVLMTGTVLLDCDEHIRSFQAENLTYKDVVDVCNDSYKKEKAGTIMKVGDDSVLPHFILQYKETDWQFLKRMCAMAGGMLMPEWAAEGIKYFFGMPRRAERITFDTTAYTMMCDQIESYVIESREIYPIGGKTEFMGKTLYIWKIESQMRGGELYHNYYITSDSRGLIRTIDTYNKDMTGVSLYGKIKVVEGEKVKITIEQDENSKNSGSRWFPFSTVYSSADGAGWYCMPEAGDKVRLYIPEPEETDAYVCSAVHENKGDGIRTNPDHKIWRNKQGNEIRLTPDKILLTNNNGTWIELSDSQGIRMNSNSTVSIRANGQLRIASENSGIEISASNRIRIQQGDSEVRIQDGIEFSGAKVNMH